jgi:hypothetical protein
MLAAKSCERTARVPLQISPHFPRRFADQPEQSSRTGTEFDDCGARERLTSSLVLTVELIIAMGCGRPMAAKN